VLKIIHKCLCVFEIKRNLNNMVGEGRERWQTRRFKIRGGREGLERERDNSYVSHYIDKNKQSSL